MQKVLVILFFFAVSLIMLTYPQQTFAADSCICTDGTNAVSDNISNFATCKDRSVPKCAEANQTCNRIQNICTTEEEDEQQGSSATFCCSTGSRFVDGKCLVGDQAPVDPAVTCATDQFCDRSTRQCKINNMGNTTSDFSSVFGTITPPAQLGALNQGTGSDAISAVLQKIIQLIYMAAGIIFLFMVLISGVQWMLSGGNKEGIAAAKGRLTWAIIGITILAFAFLIVRIVSVITGFEFFSSGLTADSGSQTTQVVTAADGLGERGMATQSVDSLKRAAQLAKVKAGLIPLYGAFAGIPSAGEKTVSLEEGEKGEGENSLADYSDEIVREGGTRPRFTIKQVYDQRNNWIDSASSYDGVCSADRASRYSIPMSTCFPTSLAMIVDAFKGSVNSQRPQRLSELFFFNNGQDQLQGSGTGKLLSCRFGTYVGRVMGYQDTNGSQSLGAKITEVYLDSISFEDAADYYKKTGMPFIGRTHYEGNSSVYHYVVVAGISDSYVYIADPLGGTDKIRAIPRETYSNSWHVGAVVVKPL